MHRIDVHRFNCCLASLLVIACSGSKEPAHIATTSDAGVVSNETSSAGIDVPLQEDTAPAAVDCKLAASDGTICSCTEIGQDPPTLYLVLDRSGSMAELAPGTSETKWHMVREALVGDSGVLRRLGSRIRVALTWFPSPSDTTACNPGREVFPPTVGGQDTYDELETKLASALPRGATPTAATLGMVKGALAKIGGPVHVLLATDGAPNCGSKTCAVDACTYNLEHSNIFVDSSCDSTINCCDPAQISTGLGWKGCVDAEATAQAAAEIASGGHKVFVLGVPGTIDAYRAHLDQVAVSGGAPNAGTTKYWAPTDAASLTAALSSIAARAIDSCEVRLAAPVADPGITNVLLDGEPVPQDGWTWTSDATIELQGDACDRIKDGTVDRVQVVVGCRTVTR